MALRDVKNRLSEVVDPVEREHDRVVITRHGKAAAVVISTDDLESLEETLQEVSRPELIAQVRDSLSELAAGEAEVLSKEEILATAAHLMPKQYKIAWTPTAKRTLQRLPENVSRAAIEFIYGSLASNAKRVGKALRFDLEGLHSARRGDYRIVYRIDDRVTIIAIEHRADVYR